MPKRVEKNKCISNPPLEKSCLMDGAWDLFKDSQKETGDDNLEKTMPIAVCENASFKLMLRMKP